MLAFMTQSVYNEVSIRFTEKLHLGVCVCVFSDEVCFIFPGKKWRVSATFIRKYLSNSQY